jgi:hypothetical protein
METTTRSDEWTIQFKVDASNTKWIPISDKQGIWNEPRYLAEEREQNVSSTPQEEELRDWSDDETDETSLIRNSIHEREEPETKPSHSTPPKATHLCRQSSGSVWKGIQQPEDSALKPSHVSKGIQPPEDEDYSTSSSDFDSSLESVSDDDEEERDDRGNSFWKSIIDPVSIENMVPQNVSRPGRRDNLERREGERNGPIMNQLKNLTDMISFDYMFGAIPTEEDLRQSMFLRSNMNAALGLHVSKKKDEIVISSFTEGSKLVLMGFQPGMRIFKINDEPCPKTISRMHEMMQLKIEATIDEQTNTTKVIVFGVNEPHLDLHVHKENAASKHTFISKVEEGSKLATAGFQAGMRITKINDRPCPEAFLDMVKLMTVKVEVFPIDLERQKGDLQDDIESPLPDNENVRLSTVEAQSTIETKAEIIEKETAVTGVRSKCVGIWDWW